MGVHGVGGSHCIHSGALHPCTGPCDPPPPGGEYAPPEQAILDRSEEWFRQGEAFFAEVGGRDAWAGLALALGEGGVDNARVRELRGRALGTGRQYILYIS